MAPVMPSTKKARSRMMNAGVETGAKMLGVSTGAAPAVAAEMSSVPMTIALRRATAPPLILGARFPLPSRRWTEGRLMVRRAEVGDRRR